MFTFFQQGAPQQNIHQVIRLPKVVSSEINEELNKKYDWHPIKEKPDTQTDIKLHHYLVEAVIIRDNTSISQLLDYDADSDVFYVVTHDAIATVNIEDVSRWRFCFLTFWEYNKQQKFKLMEVKENDK